MEHSEQVTHDRPGISVVVMAKAAIPGRVKTRLTRGDRPISPEQAARVHVAMFETVLRRLETAFSQQYPGGWNGVLAMDDPDFETAAGPWWAVVPQGEGDLGQRLDRVWQHCIRATGQHAAVFFGIDCPDVPAEVLESIGPALRNAQAAVGPVSDGGYWTLAAREYLPGLLQGIDWGTPSVYDQTVSAARRLGVSLAALPEWHDVDEPADLQALLARLAETQDPSLRKLGDQLRTTLRIPSS